MSVLHWVFLLCPVLGEHSTVLYLCSAVTVQAKPRKAKFYFFFCSTSIQYFYFFSLNSHSLVTLVFFIYHIRSVINI